MLNTTYFQIFVIIISPLSQEVSQVACSTSLQGIVGFLLTMSCVTLSIEMCCMDTYHVKTLKCQQYWHKHRVRSGSVLCILKLAKLEFMMGRVIRWKSYVGSCCHFLQVLNNPYYMECAALGLPQDMC